MIIIILSINHRNYDEILKREENQQLKTIKEDAAKGS